MYLKELDTELCSVHWQCCFSLQSKTENGTKSKWVSAHLICVFAQRFNGLTVELLYSPMQFMALALSTILLAICCGLSFNTTTDVFSFKYRYGISGNSFTIQLEPIFKRRRFDESSETPSWLLSIERVEARIERFIVNEIFRNVLCSDQRYLLWMIF